MEFIKFTFFKIFFYDKNTNLIRQKNQSGGVLKREKKNISFRCWDLEFIWGRFQFKRPSLCRMACLNTNSTLKSLLNKTYNVYK